MGKKENLINISEDELLRFREEKKSYQEIAEYYKSQGKVVSWQTIRRRCKELYERIGRKEPYVATGPKLGKPRKQLPEELIYEMRKQGLSFVEISKRLKEEHGIEVSPAALDLRCKAIFGRKNEIDTYRHTSNFVSDEDIIELREAGLGPLRMSKVLEERGIRISPRTVDDRCKKIYKALGRPRPRTAYLPGWNKIIPRDDIVELKNRGMTHTEIVEFFKNKGISISRATVSRRLHDERKKQTLEQLDEKLNENLDKKAKSGKLVGEYEMLEAQRNIEKGQEEK